MNVVQCFHGRVALETGGASGIGLGIVERVVKEVEEVTIFGSPTASESTFLVK